jgi:hypothetical protein
MPSPMYKYTTLRYTFDEKTLLQYDENHVEVFDFIACKIRFQHEGRIIGLSRDSSFMIVHDASDYHVLRLTDGKRLAITDVDADEFEVHERRDVISDMTVIDVFTKEKVLKFQLPQFPQDEDDDELQFGGTMNMRFIGTPYIPVYVHDNSWEHSGSFVLYHVGTGEYILSNYASPYFIYEPIQKIIIHYDWLWHLSFVSVEKQAMIGVLQLLNAQYRPGHATYTNRLSQKSVKPDESVLKSIATHPQDYRTIAISDKQNIYLINLDIDASKPYGHSRTLDFEFKVDKVIQHRGHADSMMFHPDGEHLVLTSKASVSILNLNNEQVVCSDKPNWLRTILGQYP